MNGYVMPELTKEEIRRMTKTVVQRVAAKKLFPATPLNAQSSRSDRQVLFQQASRKAMRVISRVITFR